MSHPIILNRPIRKNENELSHLQAIAINKMMPKGFKLESTRILNKETHHQNNIFKRMKIDAYGFPISSAGSKRNNTSFHSLVEEDQIEVDVFSINDIVNMSVVDNLKDLVKMTHKDDYRDENKVVNCTIQPQIPQIDVENISVSPITNINLIEKNNTSLLEDTTAVVAISPCKIDITKDFKNANKDSVIMKLPDFSNLSKINHPCLDFLTSEKNDFINNLPTRLPVAEKCIKRRKFSEKNALVVTKHEPIGLSSIQKSNSKLSANNKETDRDNLNLLLTEIRELKEKYCRIEKEINEVKKSKTIKRSHSKNLNKKTNFSQNKTGKTFTTSNSLINNNKKTITEEDKTNLVININKLSLEQKKDMRIIIKDQIKIIKGGEFEFNINQLPYEVFRSLQKYVSDCLKSPIQIMKVKTSEEMNTREIKNFKESNKFDCYLNSPIESTYESENSDGNKQHFIGIKRNFLMMNNSVNSVISSSLDSSSISDSPQ